MVVMEDWGHCLFCSKGICIEWGCTGAYHPFSKYILLYMYVLVHRQRKICIDVYSSISYTKYYWGKLCMFVCDICLWTQEYVCRCVYAARTTQVLSAAYRTRRHTSIAIIVNTKPRVEICIFHFRSSVKQSFFFILCQVFLWQCI